MFRSLANHRHIRRLRATGSERKSFYSIVFYPRPFEYPVRKPRNTNFSTVYAVPRSCRFNRYQRRRGMQMKSFHPLLSIPYSQIIHYEIYYIPIISYSHIAREFCCLLYTSPRLLPIIDLDLSFRSHFVGYTYLLWNNKLSIASVFFARSLSFPLSFTKIK